MDDETIVSYYYLFIYLFIFKGKITLVNPDLKKFLGTSEGTNSYLIDG